MAAAIGEVGIVDVMLPVAGSPPMPAEPAPELPRRNPTKDLIERLARLKNDVERASGSLDERGIGGRSGAEPEGRERGWQRSAWGWLLLVVLIWDSDFRGLMGR